MKRIIMAAVVAMFTLGIVNQAQAGTIGVRQNPGGNWVMTYNGMPTKSFGTDKQGCVEYAKNIAQVTGSGYDSSGETGNGTDTDGGSGTDTGGGSGTNTGGGGTGTGGAGGGGAPSSMKVAPGSANLELTLDLFLKIQQLEEKIDSLSK